MKEFDPSLYFVTDSKPQNSASIYECVLQAVEGGITMVQLREKSLPPHELRETALNLLRILRPKKIPLLLNDHVFLAKEVGAQGVHLGSKDLSLREARIVLGKEAIIGFSVETDQDFSSLDLVEADYIAASPVFFTNTKKDIKRPFQIEGLSALRKQCRHPLIAIGGISLDNIDSVLATGVNGVAVITAILHSQDPRNAAQELKSKILKHREASCHSH